MTIIICILAVIIIILLIWIAWIHQSAAKSRQGILQIVENNSDAIILIDGKGLALKFCNNANNPVTQDFKQLMDEDSNVLNWLDAASRKRLQLEIKTMVESHQGDAHDVKLTLMGNNYETNVTLCPTSNGNYYMVFHVASVSPAELSNMKDRAFLMENLLENLPVVTSVKDMQKHGAYMLWNHQSEILFGVSKDEILGKTSEVLPSQIAQAFLDMDRITMQEGEHSSMLQLKNAQGKDLIVILHKKQLSSADGRRWIISTAMDVTQLEQQRKLLGEKEDELMRALKEAAESNNLKSQFLANMSHEVRTPLNVIVGFSDLIAEEENAEVRRSVASEINRNAAVLVKVIDGIMELSRIQTGEIHTKLKSVNLSTLMRSVMNGNTTNSVDIIEKTELPDVDYYIDTDRELLTSILSKLLDNARKYTQAGGIVMGYEMRLHEAHIFVKDTGNGISDENKKHLFDRFEKHGSMVQGVGVGLAICKALVTLLGGTIGCDSTVGKGTTMWIDLPCKPKTKEGPSTLERFLQKSQNKDLN